MWCANAASEYRRREAYLQLAESHAAVHAHGKEAARLFEAGRIDDALGEAEAAEEHAWRVVRCLDALADTVGC